MKITEIEAIILRQPVVDGAIADGSQDDLIVRVHTDEGIVGIGEVDSAPEVVKAVIDAPNSHYIATGLRHVLLGQDPLDIEALWRRMYMGSVYYGRRGVAMHAISGIDIALWDIKGKKLGKPVCELLGTKKRERVRPYASLLMPDSEREVMASVERLVTMGFTAIKFGWGPIGKDEKHDVRLARAAKHAAGAGVEILIDAGFGYGADAKRAIRVARELEDIGIYWLEEPFEPDEFEAYAELADAVELRIAAGEEEATRWGFRELVERGHVDVIQPDVTRCGGLSEALKIARAAEERGVPCVPHAWKSGVIKAASLHLNAVLETAYFQEYCVAETPINRLLTRERMELEDGWVAVPTRPGLGIELDPEILARYAVGSPPLPVA
ncbi:MAG: mandelate racemase/muconate lactonizing enzyme family protein [Casimicrobiaceae bacterium]